MKLSNLFFLLALMSGILSLVSGFMFNGMEAELKRQLTIIFASIAMVMLVIGVIYIAFDKMRRPVSKKLGLSHYIITIIAVVCGVICTVTSHDGVTDGNWTAVPKCLAFKLFILSVAVFLFALISSLVKRRHADSLQ